VADSENQILPKTDASFNADAVTNGGEIRISRGGVETTIGGEKSTITENEFASVNGGKLSQRERLLAPPRPTAPGNSAQLVDPAGNGISVVFSWQDPEGNAAANYYIQISRSPTFAYDAIMVDRNRLTGREFRLTGLVPGNYYWSIWGGHGRLIPPARRNTDSDSRHGQRPHAGKRVPNADREL
jgi:hypothetical protein